VVKSAVWFDGIRRLPVAVKIITPEAQSADPSGGEGWLEESIFLRKIRSPFIVTFYGLSGNDTLVMEKMTLGCLQSAIRNKAPFIIPGNIRLQVMLDVIQGLEYLHGLNCIHGDVKSQSVLLTEDGGSLRAKLSDFGSSHTRHHADSTAIAPSASILWAAPEVFERPPIITSATDIYSYGVVMWELFSLMQPFSECSSSPVTIVTRVLAGERDDLPIGTPPTISEIIQSCWFRSPEDRPRAQTIRSKLLAETKPPPIQFSSNPDGASLEYSDYEKCHPVNSITL
jgi:serine/threonine protein kinase